MTLEVREGRKFQSPRRLSLGQRHGLGANGAGLSENKVSVLNLIQPQLEKLTSSA